MSQPYGYGPVNAQTAFLSDDFYPPLGDVEALVEMIAKREALTATMLNVREIAFYDPAEILTGQSWFSNQNQTVSRAQNRRIAFRRVFDLVQLNSGPIGVGVTQIGVYPLISPIAIPTKSFGAATIAGPKYVFFPSADISVTFDNSNPNSQKIIITNNLAVSLSQCYYTIEYLKQT